MPALKEIVEPFPGWRSPDAWPAAVRAGGSTLGATWAKGSWTIAHLARGFRVRRHTTDSKGSPIVVAQEKFPTLEAAVMFADLKGED